MKTVHKFPLVATVGKVKAPADWLVKHVGYDADGKLCIWAEVYVGAPLVDQSYQVLGTGQHIDDPQMKHAGTAIEPDGHVWHVYLAGVYHDSTPKGGDV